MAPTPHQRRARRLTLRAAAALFALACSRSQAADPPARHVATIDGFGGPESVQYDGDQDVFFVSNIVGYGSSKDNDAYLSRVDASRLEAADVFVRSGVNGVELHAPKGMAIQGDTLWVADIDVLRGFHRRSGAPVATLDLRPHGAVLLNGVALGPDGNVVITDTGIIMSDKGVLFVGGAKIFSVAPDRTVSVLARGDWLEYPNGIDWDPTGKRWLVATFHPFTSTVYGLRPGDTTKTVLARGNGRYDGLLRLDDGRLLVTSWPDSALYAVDGDRTTRLVREIWQPADLGWDTRRRVVAIPLVLQGRVEFWQIAARP